MTLRVLVTGASSGIGKAIATTLAEKGLVVFGTSRHADDFRSLPFPVLPLDVRSDASVDACVAAMVSRVGGVDVLINNAGYALTGAAEETSIDEAKEQFDTNFFGRACHERRPPRDAGGSRGQDHHYRLAGRAPGDSIPAVFLGDQVRSGGILGSAVARSETVGDLGIDHRTGLRAHGARGGRPVLGHVVAGLHVAEVACRAPR